MRKKVGKQELAQWVSLALQKSLIPRNISHDFRIASIQPLNKDAMMLRMEASEDFKHFHDPMEPSEEPSQESQSIQIEEIFEEGLPSPPRSHTHYYVNVDDEFPFESNESPIAASNLAILVN